MVGIPGHMAKCVLTFNKPQNTINYSTQHSGVTFTMRSQRERERQRERQTYRQTDRQTEN